MLRLVDFALAQLLEAVLLLFSLALEASGFLLPCLPPVRDPRRPNVALPKGSIDTHVHVFEHARYKMSSARGYNPPDSTLADLKAMPRTDLKKDFRLKYVSVFKNQGELAGEEWAHAHSEITGTIFVPRRIKYELRASREWFKEKERCVFCDILAQEERQQDALAKERKQMVGSGDRSEKIRTYNFPQNRLTDHRIGFTLHQLDQVMDGKLQPIIDALVTHYQAEKLKGDDDEASAASVA